MDNKTNKHEFACNTGKVTEYEVKEHIDTIAGSYKGIGFDVIGLDPVSDTNLTRHKKLFASRDIVNIENLKNLALCGSGLFWFSCFPLKIKDGDPSQTTLTWWERYCSGMLHLAGRGGWGTP